MSELVEKGKQFYEEKLKAKLEPEENGKFVAIEPDSGNFFAAERAVDAVDNGRAALPDKMFFPVRVGYPTAHKIGGRIRINRQ